ncbi:flagellar hook-basal body complex protein FliE [Leifsonia aquatica]|uniref:Flagellar hook-basal body complex protein FliE n=2 Tax=Leifsonia aquatica TaxID=144185 RepID=U2R5A8_LEIAQ|nr:flagellar hook-basal body complex protein FliE [Leifsonia aquatica]ERK70435.1 flagellar hook-basal body complex protein FliE [Leifsonia aquatica ATCC 14665]MBB2967614.1 flagellar hook-basal body complex protein FliE [Leifsonia aquatica]
MPIPAISAIGSVDATNAAAAAAVTGTAGSGGAAFGDALSGAIDNLQQLQGTSDKLAIQAVTGNLDDIHDATLASTRAQVTLELVAGVRNKAVDAFNEIMRMQA